MPSYSFFPSEKECEALKNAFGSGRIVQPIATTDASSDSTVLLRLSPEHRHYLLRRHGTLDLDPVPGPKDDDPYNWPRWKKTIDLILVSFHAMMSTFTAASIIPAYSDIAADLSVTLQQATYLTALQILIVGPAPLFWRPLSDRFGRRPIFLFSLLISLLGNIGCALSPTYPTMASCRALVAFGISPAGAIGTVVVTETFFKKDRARCMGLWTLMRTVGAPVAPFIFGFVAGRLDYRWIYWILAIINGVQVVLYVFFGPETRYIKPSLGHCNSSIKNEYLTVRRIDPSPFTLWEFIQPLSLVTNPSILVAAIAHSMVFVFGSVLVTVEVPQLFQAKFHLDAEQLGLQFLGVIIGSLLGEQVGGIASDLWMNKRGTRIRAIPPPEWRLWLSYLGFGITIVGVAVFLVCTEAARPGHWNITPVLGIAIAGFGNQVVTTVLMTYAADCLPMQAAGVGVFITFVRQLWSFVGPFWFPPMFSHVGVANSAGIITALIVIASVLPTAVLHFKTARVKRVGAPTSRPGSVVFDNDTSHRRSMKRLSLTPPSLPRYIIPSPTLPVPIFSSRPCSRVFRFEKV